MLPSVKENLILVLMTVAVLVGAQSCTDIMQMHADNERARTQAEIGNLHEAERIRKWLSVVRKTGSTSDIGS